MRTTRKFFRKDFAYCRDCKVFINMLEHKYDIKLTGHSHCRWKTVSRKQLQTLIKDQQNNHGAVSVSPAKTLPRLRRNIVEAVIQL